MTTPNAAPSGDLYAVRTALELNAYRLSQVAQALYALEELCAGEGCQPVRDDCFEALKITHLSALFTLFAERIEHHHTEARRRVA
jgi:hypothetical protein